MQIFDGFDTIPWSQVSPWDNPNKQATATIAFLI